MSLTTLNLDERSVLTFGLDISGANQRDAQVRMLIFTDDYSVVLDGKLVKEGAAIDVPKLEGVIPPGTHPTKIEVIVEGAPNLQNQIKKLESKVELLLRFCGGEKSMRIVLDKQVEHK